MSDIPQHVEEPLGPVVADAMLHHPGVHAAELSVGEACSAFAASPKTHLLLLVRDGLLVGTLTRDDLEVDADPTAPAAGLARLSGRTVRSDAPLHAAQEAMGRAGIRRLAVVEPGGRLVGLLCFKASGTGFCTDTGVRAMRAARRLER